MKKLSRRDAIMFKHAQDRLIRTTVTVYGPKGRKTVKAIYDTGATSTLVDPALARNLGLVVLGEGKFAGLGSHEKARVIQIKLKAKGGPTLTVTGAALHHDALEFFGVRLILGADYLQQSAAVIYCASKTVQYNRLDDLPALPATPIQPTYVGRMMLAHYNAYPENGRISADLITKILELPVPVDVRLLLTDLQKQLAYWPAEAEKTCCERLSRIINLVVPHPLREDWHVAVISLVKGLDPVVTRALYGEKSPAPVDVGVPEDLGAYPPGAGGQVL